jgi:TfoX/Sxy family transcriptional regulator of competence genes
LEKTKQKKKKKKKKKKAFPFSKNYYSEEHELLENESDCDHFHHDSAGSANERNGEKAVSDCEKISNDDGQILQGQNETGRKERNK